jgi:hypothetical protein
MDCQRLLALADHVEIVKTAGASGHPEQTRKSFLHSFGSAEGSSAAAEASLAARLARPRGRAAAEASAAGAAGADAQPADPPAAARGPSCQCNGKGCKTESMMIGMNALIDFEYAAGTLSVECTDAQSMYSVQTALELFQK